MIKNKILNKNLKLFFIIICFVKLIIFLFFKKYLIFQGSDANYYHSYAINTMMDNATSIWPVFLRNLYHLDLYNREVISFIIFIISILFIPFTFNRIIFYKKNIFLKSKFYYVSLICISLYFTVFLFSVDIYRDIIMLFIFLFSIYLLKLYTYSVKYVKFIYLFLVVITMIHLYYWRHYLGVSLCISLLTYSIYYDYFRKKNLLIIYILFFCMFYFIGFFDILVNYRSSFPDAGTTLGLNFAEKNIFEFIFLYSVSIINQLFGLYFSNILSVLFFIFETLPFILAIIYIYKNKTYLNKFCFFLIIFCIIYGTIWLIANDNLGTAIRLRLFNYFSIFIIFWEVYFNKNMRINNE